MKRLRRNMLYVVAGLALGVCVFGLVEWVRLEWRSGMHDQAALAGVPYQSVSIETARRVERAANEWLLVSIMGLAGSAVALWFAVSGNRVVEQVRMRRFWGG